VTGPAGYRVDPLSGDLVYVVAHRQARPNRPGTDCPFCPGGLEAPEPYEVRWFPNRWPPFTGESSADASRAEIVLYTPKHDAAFWQLDPTEARRVVDLWAERTEALGAHDDAQYVLVFENRGAEVGATIAHPHGQIYAFDVIPPRALAELARPSARGLGPDAVGDRLVARNDRWRAWVPEAANWPYELLLAPDLPAPDLPSLDEGHRDDLAGLLLDVLARLDRLFDAPMPYMMWFHQRPTDGGPWEDAWVHLHIAPLLRGPGTPRFVAAGELGSQVFFNPVDPSDAATRLREV
jgi:UDPglucose--hexose-1-phosphate uridylyltransferase